MRKRDRVLDEIRTLLAIYTIWGHSISWFGLLSTAASPFDLDSWLLTPITSFFFLIGAANSLGRKRKLGEFYSTRLSRIYTPYIFFALGSIILCCIVSYFSGTTYPALFTENMQNNAALIGADGVNIFTPGSPLYWFFPIDKCLLYTPPGLEILVYHLWFLPMYAIIILLMPLFRTCYEKLKHKWIPLAVMAALMPVFRALRILYWKDVDFVSPLVIGIPMSVLCYGFWTYLGFYYSRLRHPTAKTKKCAIVIGILGILLVTFMLKLPDIIARLGISVNEFTSQFIYYVPGCNANHFPPNLIFMAYNIAALPFLYLLAPYILRFIRMAREKIRIVDKAFVLYENSYLIIYLFSVFAFCLVRWTLSGLGVFDLIFKNEFVGAIIMQIIMIPVCGLFGKWLAPLENFKFKRDKLDSRR